MRHNDAELVCQTLAGNQDAFGELVGRYQGLVCGLAYHLVGNFQDAEDIAQNAFLSAYVNLKQLKEPEKFGTWLRAVYAVNC
jgi:RNA polymerase sigma-70 factor (ECF subfamily)